MQIDKFTIKAQEALRDAHNLASERGQQQIDVLHLALALIWQADSIVVSILQRLGINLALFESEIEKELARLPKISGEIPFGQVFLSPELGRLINQASKEAQNLQDEFISCEHLLSTKGIRALDVGKRLLDYGLHPPTVYFPLIVKEALMIEPTETESKETLDTFAEALLKIAEEAHQEPALLKEAPHITPVGRLDEVKAAKELVLCCGVSALDK